MNVTFTEEMQLSMKKATFLANSMNKQRYINMFGSYLEKRNVRCTMFQEIDLLIAPKAVESSTVMDTVLVGDVTDLLVLLCYHASLDSHSIFVSTRTQEKHRKSQSVGYQGCKGATGA